MENTFSFASCTFTEMAPVIVSATSTYNKVLSSAGFTFIYKVQTGQTLLAGTDLTSVKTFFKKNWI